MVLPLITPKKPIENFKKNKKEIIEEKSEDDMSSNLASGNGDISESRSGEGNGSGKSDD